MPFTTIGDNSTVRSTAQMDTTLFIETSPGGSVGESGLHFNSTNFGEFKTPLGVQVIENPRTVFDSAATKRKVTSDGSFDGVINPIELNYLLASLRGKVTPTEPTNNGEYYIDLHATTGNFTLTLDGMTTENIAHNSTGDEVENIMIAGMGRGVARVTVEDHVGFVFKIVLQGEYALRGDLTVTGIGGLVGVPTIHTINPTGLGVYQYDYDLNVIDVANMLTFRAFQGPYDVALGAKRFDRVSVTSLGLDISTEQAVLTNGAILALPQVLDQTILSEDVSDIDQINAVPEGWNFYYGSSRDGSGGPKMLCSAFAASFSVEGLITPYTVIGCNTNSMKGVTAAKPNTSFGLTVAQDAESDQVLQTIQDGSAQYAVLEWVGPEIVAGVNYKILLMLPHIVEDYDPGDEQNVATYAFSGRLAKKNTLTPKIVIVCGTPAF